MPTGIALRDAREQLFAAAERVLRRDGPSGLTSRAVTDEAGVAKGVMHRHFSDFDGFLAALVLDRAARLEATAAALLASAGSGTVAGNLADALAVAFEPVAEAMLALITFRDELRARLRGTWPRGLPLLADIVAMVAAYLEAEQRLCRLAAGADVQALAPMLTADIHLRCADRTGAPPPAGEIRAAAQAALAAAVG